MLQAKFSKSLLSEPEWLSLGPTLVTSTSYGFQEDNTCICDLVLPCSNIVPSRFLNVLLLWSSDTTTAHKERIWSCLPNEKRMSEHYVVVLVENSNDVDGALGKFSCLQSRLLDLPSLPALLAFSVERILPALRHYMQELGKKHETLPRPDPLPTTLLAYATTSAQPLGSHNANVLTNLCHSIRDLEEATRTDGGQASLAQFLTPTVARDVIDFWEDEWIVHRC